MKGNTYRKSIYVIFLNQQERQTIKRNKYERDNPIKIKI